MNTVENMEKNAIVTYYMIEPEEYEQWIKLQRDSEKKNE
jgi:hypothetical protein